MDTVREALELALHVAECATPHPGHESHLLDVEEAARNALAALGPSADDVPVADPEMAWVCSHDGYHPLNTVRWCALGCGSDYNRMIGFSRRHFDRIAVPPSVVGSARLIIRAADRIARGVDEHVKVGLLNARSEPADALLDYADLDSHRAVLGLPPFGELGRTAPR